MVKTRYIGDGHPTFNRNPYNGYINLYYWVDNHPLLYGNNGSLDPSTYAYRTQLTSFWALNMGDLKRKFIFQPPKFQVRHVSFRGPVILQVQVGNMFMNSIGCLEHLSNVQNPYDIPLYWLVDRDPYNGLLSLLYNWPVKSPIYS